MPLEKKQMIFLNIKAENTPSEIGVDPFQKPQKNNPAKRRKPVEKKLIRHFLAPEVRYFSG